MSQTEATLSILLFALAREQAGCDSAAIKTTLPTDVAALRKILARDYPQIAQILARSRLAVNRSFASDDTTITGTEEIAVIPPVSGG